MKKLINWIAAALLALAAFGWAGTCGRLEDSNARADMLESNLAAARDSARFYRTRAGGMAASITAYQSEIKDLKKYSEELAARAEEYRKASGKKAAAAVTANTLTIMPAADTVFIKTPAAPLCETFDFSDPWRTLTGHVHVEDSAVRLSVDPQTVRAKITGGFDEAGNAFVMTDNPYVTITGIEGFTQPHAKAKRWGLGVQAGVGVGARTLKPEPYVGVGLSYNIWLF